MNFDITDEQRRTQQAAREFAERVLVPKADDVDRLGKIAPETIAQLGEAGWLGKTIPEAHGGADGDFVGLVLVVEELAAACANTAALVSTNVVVARALLKYGTEEQKNKLLPLIARGQTTVAHAGVEPLEMLALTRHEDGTCELNGKLAAMDVFGLPAHVLVFGYDDSAQTARAFVLPYTAQNLTATVLPGTLGKRAMGIATLPFDRVRVPTAMMIGEEGDGGLIAAAMVDQARIMAAAEAIGIARAAYERAVSHLKMQPKSNEPGLQGAQVHVADMCVDLEAARLLTLRAAQQADDDVVSSSERSMAKLFACEMANRVVHKSMQVLGGRNVLTTPSLERNLRDARMMELSADSLSGQRTLIARTMLK